MYLKIRCDGESEKFYKIFWELNKAQAILREEPDHPQCTVFFILFFKKMVFSGFTFP